MNALIRSIPLLLMLCAVESGAAAGSSAAKTPDPRLQRYATPERLLDIGDGRHLNLRCSGNGTPAILLESGAIADSMAWFSVQPALAKLTQVCFYDRAGLGFSDGGPLPRNVDAAEKDLHALLQAAQVPLPLILVGHSLGSNIVRRYAQRHGQDVAALVLVDPPGQSSALLPADMLATEHEAEAARLKQVGACADAAAAGQLEHPAAALQSCLRGPDPSYGDKLNAAIRRNHLRPVYWETLQSTFETNASLFSAPISPSERHPNGPLLVLTAVDAFADVPAAQRKPLQEQREQTQLRILATSKNAERIMVEHSSHEMMQDRPDAIIAAVTRLVQQLRTSTAAPASTRVPGAHQPVSARPPTSGG